MEKFNFDVIKEILRLSGFNEEDQKLILEDYNRLISLKIVEIADLNLEDIDSLPEGYINEKEYMRLIGEKFGGDEAKLESLGEYVSEMNEKILRIVIKGLSDDEKKEILGYLDQHEQEMKVLFERLEKELNNS